MLNNTELTPILKDILNSKRFAYYVGGSLCIDLDDMTTILELSGLQHNFQNNEEIQLSSENIDLLFEIYKKFKGETTYYKEKLEQRTKINNLC